MEFRILGRLEVLGSDGPLQWRGVKRRSLLGLLLVRAGERMTVDRIVDELWGPDASAGAGRTVQTYVSQLRQHLEPQAATITTHQGGYTLDVTPDALDSTRFERMIRGASKIGGLSARLHTIDTAIELWRGEPLDEFDGDWADHERTRLQLLHLQARDLWVDTRLALGSTTELIGELEKLVDDNPLDERFWAKLLIAYYRSGRQADALRAFQRVRQILATELGIDPGPELARLEQRILDHDAGLLANVAAGDLLTPSALPTGTVTFLFTDIAGSTQLWEERPEDMAAAVSRHHAALREAVERHEGHVVKTIGDGMMAVFADAPHALGAAIDGQRVIAASDWPIPIGVRIGLHTGTAHPIDGDYHAPTVNRAARIASAAHPEQILVSDATAALCRDTTFRDLGHHRLRGIAATRLSQVLAPDLRREFPPNAASSARGLPMAATSFVGRTTEVETVAALVAAHRLVTLTGVGGCGKTRLATEAAQRMADVFGDGVRFVDLAPVTQAAGVDPAVADALGMVAGPDSKAPRDRLSSYLEERDVLVILDNCEHLIDACADFAQAVLAGPGASRLLATSREPLGLMGEHVLVVPSLDVDTEAVALFVDRAKAARADFTMDAANRDEITQTCRRLDGIPLAIELAAARAAHLSPSQLLDRLDDRFRLLTGGQRRIQRQQTLAATLDWSYDLLDPDDQEVLRRLAVFPASLTLDAAEAVVDCDDLIERLGSLVAKSLVQTIEDDGELRYRLLESVRLYAENKLVEADEAVSMRNRHCDWVHDWLESMPLEERLLGDQDVLNRGLASLHSAIEWAVANDHVDVAATIASGVDWSRTEGWPAAFRHCELLLVNDRVNPVLRPRLALTLWWLAPIQRWSYERATAQTCFDQTTADAGPLYPMSLAATARDLIIPSVANNDEEGRGRAIELAERAVATSADCAPAWRMYCRMIAGMTYASFRQAEQAAEHFAAEQDQGAPYEILQMSLVGYRAIMCFVMGNNEQAAALAETAFSPTLWPYWSHARAVSLVALAATGDVDRARRALREYAVAARDVYWMFGNETVVLLGGVLAGIDGDWRTASKLLGAGSAGMRRTPADSILYLTFRDRAREHLGPDLARTCRDEGRAMPIDEALELALADDTTRSTADG